MSIELNLAQTTQLLAFFGGCDAGVTVCNIKDESAHSGPGLYAYCTDYPEEGSILLDPDTGKCDHGKRLGEWCNECKGRFTDTKRGGAR